MKIVWYNQNMENKKSNIIAIPGAHGYAPWQHNTCRDDEVIKPDFFVGKSRPSINDALDVLRAYADKGILTPDSEILAQSAGSIVITKFIAQENFKLKKLITAGGFMGKLKNPITSHIFQNKYGFQITDIEAEIASENIGKSHALYSNNDPKVELSELEKFAVKLNAVPYKLVNHGHFNKDSGITKIELIDELI